MRRFPNIGIQIPTSLIPKNHIDMEKWSVIACDQFTSQLEYWQSVEELIGNEPSSYNLILPEAYLETPKEIIHQKCIAQKMRDYLEARLFSVFEGMIYVEREISGKTRQGLITTLDLDCYDFNPGSQSLIRATEGTILERIPPRVKIRQDAFLEISHVMVLIDDPSCSIIEPLSIKKQQLSPLYDFDLMMGGGHINGYLINNHGIEEEITAAFHHLLSTEIQQGRYNLRGIDTPLLFAVGDGNHSLATAKSIWEGLKPNAPQDHPARFAMVEIVNIHNPAITFEPIHRIIKGLPVDILPAAMEFFDKEIEIRQFDNFSSMKAAVQAEAPTIGVLSKNGFLTIKPTKPLHTLAVGNLQLFLDDVLSQFPQTKIDYIHGEDTIQSLGRQPENIGFFLPAMNKDQLFPSIIHDGSLPQKTFSMGKAHEKRYYLESRLIRDYPYEP